jgi:hypothetical protein
MVRWFLLAGLLVLGLPPTPVEGANDMVALCGGGGGYEVIYGLSAGGELWRKDGPIGSPEIVYLHTFPLGSGPYVSITNDGGQQEFYALTRGGDIWRKDGPDGEPAFYFVGTIPAPGEEFAAIHGNGVDGEFYAVTVSGQLWLKNGTDGQPTFHLLGIMKSEPVQVDVESFGSVKGHFRR